MALFLAYVFCLTLASYAAPGLTPTNDPPIECEGTHPSHLQGITGNKKDILYWSYTTRLVKTDMKGKILAQKDVAGHHGDLCYANGKIYVAYFHPASVQIYNAQDLSFIGTKVLSDISGRVSGMEYHNGRFIIVGTKNYVYEYDGNFTQIARHTIGISWTNKYGFQTACYNDGYWWFGSYQDDAQLLKVDQS